MRIRRVQPVNYNVRMTRHPAIIVSLLIVAVTGAYAVERTPDVTALIQQLGHASFEKREAASEALLKIGEPALSKLKQAAVASNDPEIKFRAGQLIKRIARQTARQQLKLWQGRWENGNEVLIITEQYWWWGVKSNLQPNQFKRNTIRVIDITDGVVAADLQVNLGAPKTCKAIFQLKGDTLHYCGSYRTRPTRFHSDTPTGAHAVRWIRVKSN